MKFEKEKWKELDINVDSLWLMGPRTKGGKHSNMYHGNFAPQIPNQMIRRYTEEGETVLDMFMGSGTTLFECESLKRNYIGFDINQEIIDFVEERMKGAKDIEYFIHNCDIVNRKKVSDAIDDDLKAIKKKTIDHIIIHPPYLDIVKFTDRSEDLSNITSISKFLSKFATAVGNCYPFLKVGKYISLVVGDIYRNGEVIPLGFFLMYALRKKFPCALKGIVVKDIVGNRAKIGQESLWKYRALKNGNFLFKHEYVFVFKKLKK
ncbi:MAG: DNA adenine methylase [Bacteroides sp.]|nr:DNA adenine methylase [Bacteroides sp.]MCM1085065.1 DNA adenine methylase [Bacteroides sp.]